uniref:Ig-like domain-containing protein n=1 Tax=Leptobrachium leishanense TaxID=445787 RepID=A0A8C5MB30_9ANUR
MSKDVYFQSIHSTIKHDEWDKNSFSCAVNQEKKQLKNQCQELEPKDPIVRILLSSCDAEVKEVLLVCLVTNFWPGEATTIWLKNGEAINGIKSQFSPLKNVDGTFSGRIEMSVSKESWDKLEEFSCQVTHQNIKRHSNISKCSAYSGNLMPPVVELDLPLYEDVISDKYTIKCLVYGNNWILGDITLKLNGKKGSFEPKVTQHNYQTAVFKVTKAEWESADTVSCVVKQQCSKPDIESTKKIDTKYRDIKEPTIQILLPSCYDDNTYTKNMPLVCLVSNFRPGLASVTWRHKDKQMEYVDKGFISVKGKDGTFSGKSEYNVTRESWDKEDEYTCEVQLQSKTFTKKISKCSACNVASIPPTVTMVRPMEDFDDGKDKIICSVVGVNVNTEHIYLKTDGKTSNKKCENVKTLGNYMNCTFSITLDEWKKWTNVTCAVKLPCSTATVDTGITTDVTRELSVRVFHSPDSLENKILLCIADGHRRKNINLGWQHNNEVIRCTSVHQENNNDGTFTSSCTLTVVKKTWTAGNTYSCHVTYESGSKQKTINITRDISALDNSGIIPTLEMSKPSFKTLFQSKSAIVSCKTNVPNAVIQWLHNENAREGKMENISKDGWRQSTMKISLQDWKTKKLACELKYPGEVILKTIQTINTIHTPTEMKSPKVYLLPPFQESENAENYLILLCVVKGFYPQDLFISWMVNETIIPQHNSGPSDISCDHDKRQCSIASQLPITKTEWTHGTTYFCMVAHISSEEYTIQNISISSGRHEVTVSVPKIEIDRPSFKELFLDESANVSCTSHTINSTIQWMADGKPILPKYNETIFKHNMSWFQSTIAISLEEWKAISNLTCQVKDLLGAVIESKAVKTKNLEKMKAPVVQLLSSALDSVDTENKTLTCLVTAFYPGELFVKWEAIDLSIQLDDPDPYELTCDHQKEQCFYLSQISVPKKTWLKGMIYICKVAHVALESYIKMNISASDDESSTGDISVYQDEVGNEVSDIEEATNVWTTASTFIALFLLTLVYSSFVTFVKVK